MTKNDPLLEWAIAAQYIPTDCPVCGETIVTVADFKDSRAGVKPDWVHKRCWEAYNRDRCTRCHQPLNNVSPGFSVVQGGAFVCALCLRPGEEVLRARSL